MGQVPVIVYVMPAVALGLGLFFWLFRKKMMSWSDRRYSEYRVGEIARRMRLRVVEGDPAANFITAAGHYGAQTREVGGLVRQVFGDKAETTRIVLRGAPYGRPTEFIYFYRTEHAQRIVASYVEYSFDCRLSLHVQGALPPFEIVLRGSPRGIKAKHEWDLRRQSFGDPVLDKRFALTCNDPRVGPLLAPVLRQTGGGHEYLHVQGNGQLIRAVVPQPAVMFAVMALERTQLLLEHAANALVGPVVVSRMPLPR